MYYYHWVDTSACGLFVHEWIIRPVVSASLIFPWYEQGQYIIYFENQGKQSLSYTLGGLKTELIYRVYREVMNEPLVYLVIKVLDIHHLALSQFMACHGIFNKSNMTGATTRLLPLLEKLCSSPDSVRFVLFILSNYMSLHIFIPFCDVRYH